MESSWQAPQINVDVPPELLSFMQVNAMQSIHTHAEKSAGAGNQTQVSGVPYRSLNH
jgi:hypothetical protein